MSITRRTHQLPRADMTPMVNVALLLIVFFVWAKQSQRPVMVAPHLASQGKYEYYEPVSATLFLLAQNRIGFLQYMPGESAANYQEVDYSSRGLRTRLANLKVKDHTVVLIIPTAQSTVKNLVDAIDDFMINKRISFVIEPNLWPEANQMIAEYHQYTNVSETK